MMRRGKPATLSQHLRSAFSDVRPANLILCYSHSDQYQPAANNDTRPPHLSSLHRHPTVTTTPHCPSFASATDVEHTLSAYMHEEREAPNVLDALSRASEDGNSVLPTP